MAHNSRAQTLFEAGQAEAAITDYTKVLALDPLYAAAYVNRAAAFAKTGQQELAITDLNKALNLDSTNAGALFTRGLVHKQMKSSTCLWSTSTGISRLCMTTLMPWR